MFDKQICTDDRRYLWITTFSLCIIIAIPSLQGATRQRSLDHLIVENTVGYDWEADKSFSVSLSLKMLFSLLVPYALHKELRDLLRSVRMY